MIDHGRHFLFKGEKPTLFSSETEIVGISIDKSVIDRLEVYKSSKDEGYHEFRRQLNMAYMEDPIIHLFIHSTGGDSSFTRYHFCWKEYKLWITHTSYRGYNFDHCELWFPNTPECLELVMLFKLSYMGA